ncbi:MAG: hydroxyacid dehydrogenase [Thermoplasmata archaeon]|nr:MAG: hydroxyacid dehydrogenase [Thermoplasmata archaeon]
MNCLDDGRIAIRGRIIPIPREAGSVVPVNAAPHDALIMDEAREEEARARDRNTPNTKHGQPPRVIVTYKIMKEGRELLEKYFEVEYFPGISEEELIHEVSKGVYGLVVSLNTSVTSRVLEFARGLKIISTQSAGYDHIDVKKATELGIVVTRVVGLLQETVAEHAVALMLALARRITLSDKIVREGLWTDNQIIWSMFKDLPLMFGKTAGILGMGEIGKRLIPKLKGLGMRVIYFSRSRRDVDAEYVSFNELLRESDVIFITLPLTDETRGLIDYEKLKMMKKGAYIVNIGRGEVIVEKDLVKALKEGIIGGAALDVFEKEPINKDNELLSFDNVILTPHYAGTSREALRNSSYIAAKNVVDFYLGKVPLGIVNREVLGQK